MLLVANLTTTTNDPCTSCWRSPCSSQTVPGFRSLRRNALSISCMRMTNKIISMNNIITPTRHQKSPASYREPPRCAPRWNIDPARHPQLMINPTDGRGVRHALRGDPVLYGVHGAQILGNGRILVDLLVSQSQPSHALIGGAIGIVASRCSRLVMIICISGINMPGGEGVNTRPAWSNCQAAVSLASHARV